MKSLGDILQNKGHPTGQAYYITRNQKFEAGDIGAAPGSEPIGGAAYNGGCLYYIIGNQNFEDALKLVVLVLHQDRSAGVSL